MFVSKLLLIVIIKINIFVVIEGLVKISGDLLSLGELKASLQAWKCFTFVTKINCEDKKCFINWAIPIEALFKNISNNLSDIDSLADSGKLAVRLF